MAFPALFGSERIFVSGTAPIAAEAGPRCQAICRGRRRAYLEIIAAAIVEAGGSLDHVTRSRVMLTDIMRWQEAARAHGEFFGSIRPACTFVQVAGSIEPAWLVDIEAEAVVG